MHIYFHLESRQVPITIYTNICTVCCTYLFCLLYNTVFSPRTYTKNHITKVVTLVFKIKTRTLLFCLSSFYLTTTSPCITVIFTFPLRSFISSLLPLSQFSVSLNFKESHIIQVLFISLLLSLPSSFFSLPLFFLLPFIYASLISPFSSSSFLFFSLSFLSPHKS